jgi:hypothetical protein
MKLVTKSLTYRGEDGWPPGGVKMVYALLSEVMPNKINRGLIRPSLSAAIVIAFVMLGAAASVFGACDRADLARYVLPGSLSFDNQFV